jgi:hypothetical protein
MDARRKFVHGTSVRSIAEAAFAVKILFMRLLINPFLTPCCPPAKGLCPSALLLQKVLVDDV